MYNEYPDLIYEGLISDSFYIDIVEEGLGESIKNGFGRLKEIAKKTFDKIIEKLKQFAGNVRKFITKIKNKFKKKDNNKSSSNEKEEKKEDTEPNTDKNNKVQEKYKLNFEKTEEILNDFKNIFDDIQAIDGIILTGIPEIQRKKQIPGHHQPDYIQGIIEEIDKYENKHSDIFDMSDKEVLLSQILIKSESDDKGEMNDKQYISKIENKLNEFSGIIKKITEKIEVLRELFDEIFTSLDEMDKENNQYTDYQLNMFKSYRELCIKTKDNYKKAIRISSLLVELQTIIYKYIQHMDEGGAYYV